LNLNQILEEWEKDAAIDPLRLSASSLDTAKLHHKYYSLLVGEKGRLRVVEKELAARTQLLTDWMEGTLTRDEMKENNLEPYLIKRLKSDIEKRVQLLPEIVALQDKVQVQRLKIEALDSILKMIANRGFQIKNAIDYMRLQNGG